MFYKKNIVKCITIPRNNVHNAEIINCERIFRMFTFRLRIIIEIEICIKIKNLHQKQYEYIFR